MKIHQLVETRPLALKIIDFDIVIIHIDGRAQQLVFVSTLYIRTYLVMDTGE